MTQTALNSDDDHPSKPQDALGLPAGSSEEFNTLYLDLDSEYGVQTFIKNHTKLLDEEAGEKITKVERLGPGVWAVIFEEDFLIRFEFAGFDGRTEHDYYMI